MIKNILHVENLKISYAAKTNFLGKVTEWNNAVDNVSFDIDSGEIVGIIGESGCGKSSLAKALVGLNKFSATRVVFDWQYNLHELKTSQEWLKVRRNFQIIFQDPIASLDPSMTIGEIIAEPLRYLLKANDEKIIKQEVLSMMRAVGLQKDKYYRYPHEFSGGQCQRIGIARALIVKPKLVICDEPVSALDVSIQAQVINLLIQLKKNLKLTMIFISHDLSVVRYVCDRIFVMYSGKIVEKADTEDIFSNPQHPYTKQLLSAARGEKNNNINLTQQDTPTPHNCVGCKYLPLCPYVQNICSKSNPELEITDKRTHEVACWNAISENS
ncbi:MAG: ATP-binding cassette domain-containing protein [Cytophagales bacterium]|nr:ATP-binding cassette domain-containing protein [Cytophagales bacterium]